MSEFIDAVPVDEMVEGSACTVEVDGRELCIVRSGGSFYALQNECSHGSFPLGEGDVVDEGVLECPGHAATFNVATGEPVSGPATEPLETYDVEVVDGMVRVSIE